jgi:hypothetical protein
LKTSHEDVALAEIVFIVQCDIAQRHYAPSKASLPSRARYFQTGVFYAPKYRVDNARGKLGAATRTEAAIKAATGKLIEP